jgi:hypothetical protein
MKDAALLDLITKQPHGKAGIKHLFKLLHLNGDQRVALETALERMTERGDLIELPNRAWQATYIFPATRFAGP